MTAPSREPTEAMRLLASQLLRCNCGAESGYEESGAPIIHDGRCAVRYRLAVARALAEQDTAARLAGFAEARELAELVVIRGGGQPSWKTAAQIRALSVTPPEAAGDQQKESRPMKTRDIISDDLVLKFQTQYAIDSLSPDDSRSKLADFRALKLAMMGAAELAVMAACGTALEGEPLNDDGTWPHSGCGTAFGYRVKVAGRAEASAWRPIAEAPKSLAEGSHVHGVYLLGFVPEEGVVDRASCIQVIWWEPLMPNRRGFKGCWCGEDGEDIQPTHFILLPPPPEGGES